MSVFCFSPEIVDFHLFQLWLRGLTVQQATSAKEGADHVLRDVIEMDTADHFRLFEELQPSLEEPRTTLCLMEVAPNVRRALAEAFYSFDDAVVREFLGRKFTSRAKKDLDEISEITGVPRRSCLRQFDNLKRIFDAGDEVGFQISYPSQLKIADVLGAEFQLPRHLMQRYEAILFLIHHRFNLTTGRKKNVIGSLRDYEYCASVILNAWCVKAPFNTPQTTMRQVNLEGFESPPTTVISALVAAAAGNTLNPSMTPAIGPGTGEVFSPFELDAALFAKFRDLKTRAMALTGEICISLLNLIDDLSLRKRVDARFRPWFRALLSCATGKDLKDFFEDLSVTVVEPLIEMRVSIDPLFDLLDRAVAQNFTSSYDMQVWSALMAGMRPCVSRFSMGHAPRSFQDSDAEDDY